MRIPRWIYRRYADRLRRGLDPAKLPGHVAVVMDGNRRWARQMGYDNPSVGHRHGAEHVEQLLEWCAELGIHEVTVYVASSDNIRKRADGEVGHLMRMIEEVVTQRLLLPSNPWRLRVAGRLHHLPDSTARALQEAEDITSQRDTGPRITVAVSYDGHEEIVDAVRTLFANESGAGTGAAELAERLHSDDIAAHLRTAGDPPDLIIRTSGERRLSSFLLWQSARSELYFCDVYWPGFRFIDLLRALRDYAGRRASQAAGAAG